MKFQASILFIVLLLAGTAQAASEIVCSYAPSQSKAVAAISGAAGGAAATASAMAAATGLTAVTHSSGVLILTGSSGYIAGTLGGTAATVAAAPVVVVVGLVVGGAVVSLELVCASKNHPDQVEKVLEAANEFSSRFSKAMESIKVASADMRKTVDPAVSRAALAVKRMGEDVWGYVYR